MRASTYIYEKKTEDMVNTTIAVFIKELIDNIPAIIFLCLLFPFPFEFAGLLKGLEHQAEIRKPGIVTIVSRHCYVYAGPSPR